MVRCYVYPGPASCVVGGRFRYDQVVGLEDESAAACVLGHPQKRDFRKPRVSVAATDVAVSPGEPDLLERLILRIVLLHPEGRPEWAASLIDGDRVVGVAHVSAERRVMKRPQPAQPGRTETVEGEAERADGVPDADEVDVDLRVRIRAPEQFGCDAARRAVPLWVAIERVRLLDPISLLEAQDPGVAHQPDGASGRVRATAEAEEVELVSRLVVLDQEAVTVLDVAGETDAEPSADEPLAAARADAGFVVQHLRVARVVLVRESQRDLRHVRRRRDTLFRLIRAVPGAVTADNQTLHTHLHRRLSGGRFRRRAPLGSFHHSSEGVYLAEVADSAHYFSAVGVVGRRRRPARACCLAGTCAPQPPLPGHTRRRSGLARNR